MIYLDNAASAPPSESTLNIITQTLRDYPANPSAVHQMGVSAKKAYNYAKQSLASMLGAHWKNLVITGSATEASNQAIKGVHSLHPHKTIVSSTIEHAATETTLKALEAKGAHVVRLSVDTDGRILPKTLDKVLNNHDVSLVTLIHAHNEIGTLQSIESIVSLTHSHGALLHMDMVQSAGHMPINLEAMGIDLASFSAHKFHGPKGIGMLYSAVPSLPPLIHGGGHEEGMRSGTLNLAGIKGMEHALSEVIETMDQREATYRACAKALTHALKNEGVDFKVIGPPLGQDRLHNIINIAFKDADNTDLGFALSEAGIMVATKSACATGSIESSPTMHALGVDEDYINGTLRISLNASHTPSTMQHVAKTIAHHLK